MKPAITTIQKLAKAGKIISRIIFILAIVAACLTVFALVFYIVIGDRSLVIGGITFDGLIQQELGQMLPRPILIIALCMAAVLCISEIILSQMAVTYFRRELEDGSPFTFRGAKELKRLGLWTIFLPLGVAFVSAVAMTAVAAAVTGADSVNLRFSVETGSIGTGIFLLIVSVFCRHGAETQQGQAGPQVGAGQQWTPQMGYTNQQWNAGQQWTQQDQMNRQWADRQAQANQQWADQQAQANQQWADQQAQANQQGPKDQFRQEQ